jgi:hypothetical protein
LDVGQRGVEFVAGNRVGELLDVDVVDVAEAEGVVVGVEEAGKELGEGGRGVVRRWWD